AGEGGIDRYHALPSIRSCDSEDDEERAAPRITNALGEVVILHHVADPQVFVIDRVVVRHQRVSFLVVEVAALARDVPLRLGEDQDTLVQQRPVAILLAGATVIPVAPLVTRNSYLLAPLDATEERLIGLVESSEHIVYDMRVESGVLRHTRGTPREGL